MPPKGELCAAALIEAAAIRSRRRLVAKPNEATAPSAKSAKQVRKVEVRAGSAAINKDKLR